MSGVEHMNTKDKKEVADIVAQALQQLLTAKKQDTPVKKGKQTPKTPLPPPEQIPPHQKAEIPSLIASMTPKQATEVFGDMLDLKTKPYSAKISPFYALYNIQLADNPYDKKNLTYEQKHLVILKQLENSTKAQFTAQKTRHLKYLRDKVKNPPEHDMWGNPLTDKKLESMTANLQKEIARWESATPKQ
jgi:hypothetical protein